MGKIKHLLLAAFINTCLIANAQNINTPVIDYTLAVDTANLTGHTIKISIQHAPHTLKLAMATHHEYDDRFWRYVENFTVITNDGKGSFIHPENDVWQVSIPGDEVTVTYRIHLPTNYPYHPCHRPFLAAYGGLVGDIHSFMYPVGYEHVPSRVTFAVPVGWQVATGLTLTNKPNVFIAENAGTLVDCPVFTGHLRTWQFDVQGVRHRIVYLPLPNARPFDTALLASNIRKIVQQAVKLFGAMPYHHYTFMLRDGTYGALEHKNSVMLGASSDVLADKKPWLYEELAHEYVHTWNLLAIRPAEYTDINYGKQQASEALWFSEGLSMFYADLLLRRAGLPAEDSTRITHLEYLTRRYYADTGNTFITPAKVSLATNEQPGTLGDYNTSTHLQGELLAAMLDLVIRNATGNNKNIDDVMRTMYARFGKGKGYYVKDIQQAVHGVCNCDVQPFFETHVYKGEAIDFNKYLALIGKRLIVSYAPAKDGNGRPAPDMRVYVFRPVDDTLYHLAIMTPNSCWVRAGLHTGDAMLTVNGKPAKSIDDFYRDLPNVHIGDNVIIEVKGGNSVKKIPVVISGYNEPVTKIVSLENTSTRQRELLGEWERGN